MNNFNQKGIKGVFEKIFGKPWPYWLGGLLISIFDPGSFCLNLSLSKINIYYGERECR